MKYWTLRLLVLREGRTGELEVEGVLNALKKALGPEGCNIVTDVDIRPIQGNIYYTLTDNRQIDTVNLSDGYRRLINIVSGPGFPMYAFKQRYLWFGGLCAKTEGTVLIDEIDLHLHPTLQAVVMKGLQLAFPKIQFIITSHAPMIMTGVPMDNQNKIIKAQL